MKSKKTTLLITLFCIICASISGYLLSVWAMESNEEIVSTGATKRPWFWRDNKLGEWKKALVSRAYGVSPAWILNDDFIIMAENLPLLSSLLDDETIPAGERFELGAGLFSLATVYNASKDEGTSASLTFSDNIEEDIIGVAIKGLRFRYDIARKIRPPAALSELNYAAMITGTDHNPSALVEVLKKHGWEIGLQEATDALQQ